MKIVVLRINFIVQNENKILLLLLLKKGSPNSNYLHGEMSIII